MQAIRVSIFYPAGPDTRFDHDYYVKIHMPLAGRLLQPLQYEVDKGIGGGAPGAPAPYVAGCHFYFASLADFETAITAHVAELQADIPKYTNVPPVIQISEVVAAVGAGAAPGWIAARRG